MPPGIRATVEFTTPDICPVIEFSKVEGTTVDMVNSNICPADCADSIIEFSIDSNNEFDADSEPIFSHGSTDRYRLKLDDDLNCPCACLSKFNCPVARYVAQDGALTLVFHTDDYDQLQEIIGELRDRYPDVNIKRFIRSPAGEHIKDNVFVDRSKLTSRQLEVLQTAYEWGYFERPRRANATEIAAELNINPSTFREHLVAAESKILGDLL